MDIWLIFKGMDWWMISLALAFLALGFALPFRAVLHLTAYAKRVRAVFALFLNPVIEEVVFRLGGLTVCMLFFEPLVAVLVMTMFYMVYSGLIYGPPQAADAFVLGVFFSLAFFEFGFVVVLLAHVFYSMITAAR